MGEYTLDNSRDCDMICKCTKTSAEEISKLVDSGARDWIEVSQVSGAGRYCGGCIRNLKAQIKLSKSKRTLKEAA